MFAQHTTESGVTDKQDLLRAPETNLVRKRYLSAAAVGALIDAGASNAETASIFATWPIGEKFRQYGDRGEA